MQTPSCEGHAVESMFESRFTKDHIVPTGQRLNFEVLIKKGPPELWQMKIQCSKIIRHS